MTTITAHDPPPPSKPVLPTERTRDLGELIYAHRTYMGLSQRGMARRLNFDRRDYQRIEQGRNDCPVGFLTRVTDLVELFDAVADQLVDKARTVGGITIQIQTDPEWEWERNVAGRAAVIAASEPDRPTITLTTMERSERQR